MLLGLIVTAAVLEAIFRPDLQSRGLALIITVGLAPALLWRRTRPLLMTAIAFVTGNVIPLLVPDPVPEMYSLVYLLILPYALFRWGSGREAVIGFALVFVSAFAPLGTSRMNAGDVIGGSAILLAAFALGATLRYRTTVRTRELERVKLLEREQLARDLHDTVAHHFSAIAIRAQAGLAVAASAPDAPVEALRVIDVEASKALAEMRAMVRVLRREGPAELAPNPAISDLAGLSGQPGPPVDVRLAGDLDDLNPAVGTAVYRIAQESVTNARRHARNATRIDVRVEADDRSVRLTVTDDGEPSHASAPGFGLTGMMERAGLLGGSCQAGPNPGRGWAVTAVLPRTGTPT